MASEGIGEEDFHGKFAVCVEEDEAMDTFVTALVASWEYDKFLGLVREYVADEAAMDVLEEVMGGEEEEHGETTMGSGEDDFSAFI